MLNLKIIIASTRPVRGGEAIAKWFFAFAQQHGRFEVELVDLREINLPLLDEPRHPRMAKYEHDHTKRWSALVQAGDAFVIVTPEYNFGPPPALINALDYVYREWNYKAVAFVSYGGISGGLRSVQMTKQIVTTLKMVPIVEAVAVPFYSNHIGEDGVFKNTTAHDDAARAMLDELHRWSEALKVLRP